MDDIWKRDEIDSPCVNICVIDPHSRLCIGCGRTGAEIAAWSQMKPKARRDLMEALPERIKNAQPKRRGGRKRPPPSL